MHLCQSSTHEQAELPLVNRTADYATTEAYTTWLLTARNLPIGTDALDAPVFFVPYLMMLRRNV